MCWSGGYLGGRDRSDVDMKARGDGSYFTVMLVIYTTLMAPVGLQDGRPPNRHPLAVDRRIVDSCISKSLVHSRKH